MAIYSAVRFAALFCAATCIAFAAPLTSPAPSDLGPLNSPDAKGWLRLHDTVLRGTPSQVSGMLALGADANMGCTAGGYPLTLAAYRGDERAVAALLAKGAAHSMPGERYGNAPLMVAAARGHVVVVKLLLDAGAPVDARNERGDLPLTAAAEAGHLPVVEALLAKGASVTAANRMGETALHAAARGGSPAVVTRLLRAGANVNARDEYQNTPMHAALDWWDYPHATSPNRHGPRRTAAESITASIESALKPVYTGVLPTPATASPRDRHAVVELLRKAGADLRAENAWREGLLLPAVACGEIDLVDALLAAGATAKTDEPGLCLTPLHVAPTVDLARKLLEKGADVNAISTEGETPLMSALRVQKDAAKARLLLAHGATVEGRTAKGATALHFAVAHVPELADDLLARGADPSLRNTDGCTPFHLALRAGNTIVAETLLAKGADPIRPDATGATPLHLAAVCGSPALVAKLLALKAEPSRMDTTGATPLHLACRSVAALGKAREMTWGTPEACAAGYAAFRRDAAAMVTALLAAAADPAAVDKAGRTPLHDAPSAAIAEALIKAGASVHARAADGSTPLFTVTDADTAAALIARGARTDAVNRAGKKAVDVALTDPARVAVAIYLLTDGNPGAPIPATTGAKLLILAAESGSVMNTKAVLDAGVSGDAYEPASRDAALQAAVRSGNPAVVELIVGKGARIDMVGRDGTALTLAVTRKDAAMVQALLRLGAKVDARGLGQYTPLHTAVKVGARDIADVLLKAGANPALLTGSNETLLHIAAASGDMETLAWALGQKLDIAAKTVAGMSPLHLVKTPEVARLLLDKGAAVEAKDALDNTPLLSAMQRKDAAVASTLLDAGATIRITNMAGDTPIRLALWPDLTLLIPQLIEKGADVNAPGRDGLSTYLVALRNRNALAVAAMAKVGDINVKLPNGEPLLANAMVGRNDDEVLQLLRDGADPNVVNAFGEPVISIAVSQKRSAIVQAMIAAGVRFDVKDRDGMTPLHHALMTKSDDVALLMLDKGVDVNAVSKDGLTPLMAAGRGGADAKVLQAMVAKGAVVNAADPKGFTALHEAAAFNSADMAAFLAANGANLDAPSANGYTPLHTAVLRGSAKAAEVLVARGANVNAQAADGLTPLLASLKASRGGSECAKVLLNGGADASIAGKNGDAALMFTKEPELVLALLARGANPNVVRPDGAPVLHKLIDAPFSVDAFEACLKRGADTEMRDAEGRTAFLRAACWGDPKAIDLLIQYRANPLAVDPKGNTAMHLAVLNTNSNAIPQLAKVGVPLGARNNDGRTPLELAKERRRQSVVTALTKAGAVE